MRLVWDFEARMLLLFHKTNGVVECGFMICALVWGWLCTNRRLWRSRPVTVALTSIKLFD